MKLREAIAQPQIDLKSIAARLDASDPQERLAEIWGLGGAEQARLFEAAKGFAPLSLESFVPRAAPPMSGVPHEGRNSLLAFTRFAKVFYRPDDPAVAAKELWGLNRNSWAVSTFVGPGYYVAYEKGEGEVLIDYLRVPPSAPSRYPSILGNGERLARFVYNGTQDVLRGVSAHVSIGRAMRGGKDLDNWFVLCRN